MIWKQQSITLKPRPRGFHLVTPEVVDQLEGLKAIGVGLAHFFLQHTSASLTLNENCDSDVLNDFETHMNRLVPEKADWTHTVEGPDDMPAHVKASLLDSSLTIPISEGRLCLGTWQGLYLNEHRDRGGARRLMVTLCGEAL